MNNGDEHFDPDSEIKKLLSCFNQGSDKSQIGEKDKEELLETSLIEGSPRFFRPTNYLFNLIDTAEAEKLTVYLKSHPEGVIRQNNFGETPLHRAVSFSNPTPTRLEIIRVLLRNGAEVATRDSDQKTAIHNVAQSSRAVEALELLIAHVLTSPANNSDLPEILDMQDNRGMCALHYALQSGRLESVECLLVNGASLDVREKSKNATPLLRCFFGAPDISIVEKGFGIVLGYSDFPGFNGWIHWDIDTVDCDGNTLLHAACNLGSSKLVHALLWCGAIADKKNNEGLRPIDFLKNKTSLESKKIISYLTDIGAVKSESLLLALPEAKLLSFHGPQSRRLYLARIHSLAVLPAVEVSQIQPSKNDLSSPSRFLIRHATASYLPGELSVLHDRLIRMLVDLSQVSSQINDLELYLDSPLLELEYQLNWRIYRARYQCVFNLQESADFVRDILVIPRMRLETDSALCYLIIERCTKLRENISKEIACLMRQIATMNGFAERDIESGVEKKKNIGTMSDRELKSIFSPINVSTVRVVYKDRFALEFFKAGFLDKLKEKRELAKKYSAINQFFANVQKCISLIEYCYHYHQIVSSCNSESGHITAIDQLKYLVNQAFGRQVRLEASDEVSSSTSSLVLGAE